MLPKIFTYSKQVSKRTLKQAHIHLCIHKHYGEFFFKGQNTSIAILDFFVLNADFNNLPAFFCKHTADASSLLSLMHPDIPQLLCAKV